MDQTELTDLLGREWDLPDGFFARLRRGAFDDAGAERVLALLAGLQIGEQEPLERALVRQLWYLPIFCQWQEQRVGEEGGDASALRTFTTKATNLLEEKIGVP